jgi:hypothetical protein
LVALPEENRASFYELHGKTRQHRGIAEPEKKDDRDTKTMCFSGSPPSTSIEAEQILSLTVDIAPGLLSDRREG